MDENLKRIADLLEAKKNPAEAAFLRIEKAEEAISSKVSSAAAELKGAIDEASNG